MPLAGVLPWGSWRRYIYLRRAGTHVDNHSVPSSFGADNYAAQRGNPRYPCEARAATHMYSKGSARRPIYLRRVASGSHIYVRRGVESVAHGRHLGLGASGAAVAEGDVYATRMDGRRLDGSTVVVIGGSCGIGLACAGAAHDAGASVVIAGRSTEKLSRAQARLGGSVRAVAADVTDEAFVRNLFEKVERVDHLLIAAAETAAVGVAEAEEAEVRPTLNIRVWGGFFAAKHAAPVMAESGSITFMSGTSAHRPYPGAAMVAASGGAIEAFARALALELAPVRVNTICAGFVDTPLLDTYYGDGRDEAVRELAARLPVGRIGTPEDIADAFMFLVGNGFVTGTVLHMDGGKLLV